MKFLIELLSGGEARWEEVPLVTPTEPLAFTSPAEYTVASGEEFYAAVTTNKTSTAIISGGADAAKFTLKNGVLRMAAQEFYVPPEEPEEPPPPDPTQTSADKTRAPPATQIVDSNLDVWTLDGVKVMKNGVQAAGGQATELLWFSGALYVKGTGEGLWWKWTGSGWANAGAADPTLPPVEPPPPPPSGEAGEVSYAVSDGLVNEGQTFELRLDVKGGKTGGTFKIWASGAGASDFINHWDVMWRDAGALNQGSAWNGNGGVVTLGKDGDYRITIPMSYRLDELTEGTDQAGWAAGRQEQCDIFSESGTVTSRTHVVSMWVTDVSLSPPPPVFPDAPAPTKIPLMHAWNNGVNLAGGEFGGGGQLWHQYAYPGTGEVDYFTAKGVNHFRVPFHQQRLMTANYAIINDPDCNYLDNFIAYAKTKGASVLLDMHNYGWAYDAGLIGRDPGAAEQFAAHWGTLAQRFKHHTNVYWGLMNEPNAQTASEWLVGVNKAIKAIRNVGSGHPIFVMGSYWGGAWHFTSNDNGTVMLGTVDPCNNVVFEGHQYFNHDGSGIPDQPVVPNSGTRAKPMIDWARANGKKMYIGEWGVTAAADYMAVGKAHLDMLAANKDVCVGHAYWAGGPWWGEYGFTIQPKGLGTDTVIDRAQMGLVKEYAV